MASRPRPEFRSRRAGRTLRSALLGATLLLPTPTYALEVADRFVTVGWAEASGPVDGYAVYVARQSTGFGEFPEQVTSQRAAVIRGEAGETVRIRIVAFDAEGRPGPSSPASEPITFVPLPAADPLGPESRLEPALPNALGDPASPGLDAADDRSMTRREQRLAREIARLDRKIAGLEERYAQLREALSTLQATPEAGERKLRPLVRQLARIASKLTALKAKRTDLFTHPSG